MFQTLHCHLIQLRHLSFLPPEFVIELPGVVSRLAVALVGHECSVCAQVGSFHLVASVQDFRLEWM